MNQGRIALGAVFQPDWDKSPIRVIAFDSDEIMYDTWWPNQAKWGLSSLNGTISYYRTKAKFLLERAIYLRTEELSPDELGVHRPDLPFALGQCLELQWDAPHLEVPTQSGSNIEPFPRTLFSVLTLVGFVRIGSVG
jgi:hypothetical protein